MERRHLVKTMILLTLALIFTGVAPPQTALAATTERSTTTKTTEYVDQAELNRRGLSLGSTSYTNGDGSIVTTVIVQQDATTAGRYIITTIVTDYGNNAARTNNSEYYDNGYYYSSHDLKRYAKADFKDTGIRHVAKKRHGKVSWRCQGVYDGQYAIAKLTVRNRHGRKKVYWQYTDAVGSVFTKNNLSRLQNQRSAYAGKTIEIKQIAVSDIKDFLRR